MVVREHVGVVWIHPPVDGRGVVAIDDDLLDVGVPLHRVQVGLNADGLEVLLDQLVGRLQHAALANIHVEAEWLAILLQDAVGAGLPARLAQQLLGPLGVERVLRLVRGVVVRLERGHDGGVGDFAEALLDGGDDRLAIDGMFDRLPHANVLEARVGLIQRQPVVLHQLAWLDAHLRRGLDAIDGRLVVEDHDADLAAERLRDLRVGVGHDLEHELVEVRFAAEVGVVAGQNHALSRGVRLDLERPGGDRHALVEGGVLPRIGLAFEGVLGQDAGVVRQVRRQRAERPRQVELDGRRIDGLDVLDRREVASPSGGKIGLQDDVVEGEQDVVGGKCSAVAPLDVVAQVERPAQAVGGGLPARGQVRRRSEVLAGFGQAGEEHAVDEERLDERIGMPRIHHRVGADRNRGGPARLRLLLRAGLVPSVGFAGAVDGPPHATTSHAPASTATASADRHRSRARSDLMRATLCERGSARQRAFSAAPCGGSETRQTCTGHTAPGPPRRCPTAAARMAVRPAC